MNTRAIDLVNIGLMIISCVAAFVVPFELFLFSYAVMGPLHYLTEINWLHKRNYFTSGKMEAEWLVLLCVLLGVFTFMYTGYTNAGSLMIFLAFASALAFVAFENSTWKFLFVALAAVFGVLLMKAPAFFILFSVFLPTLIHTFVFTALFMLHGTLKNKSVTGIASLLVFVVCSLTFFVFYPQFGFYQVSDYAQRSLTDSGFVQLNKAIINLFNLGATARENIFASDIGLGIMRFIAFGYTYHYLNWFSKTRVIQWHKVPKKMLVMVVVFWVISMALYAWDYKTGLSVLYLLAMLHAFMEFPLNYRSIIGIWDELGALTGMRKPASR
jgi:hypothetical protein